MPSSPAPAKAPRLDFASRLFGYDVFISFALGPAPRDRLIVGRDDDGQVIATWPAPSTWLAQLCGKLTRDMRAEAWRARVSPEVPFKAQCPAPRP